MATSVHQFHQGIRRGDAIGEEMLALRGILRRAGYDSEIFVGEPVPDDLRDEIRRLDEYREDPDQLLLLHHSLGHHYAGLISRFSDTKVLVYHNITPPRFFVGNPYMQRFLERGRRQLRTLRAHLAGAFADSRYNARELRQAGYLRIEILPPVFALGRLDRAAAAAEPPAPGHRILFVGRFATSKRQDDVVEAFDLFAARYDRNARLDLVGAADVNDPYAQLVFRRIERSPFPDRIATPGVVSDAELARLFSGATVYLSMSEHEGFGVPLLESFRAGVPVVAFDSGAVSETMGGAGILFSRKNMDEVAALVAEVASDGAFRQRIVEGQRRRLEEPDVAQADERFLSGVERWLELRKGRRSVAPSRPPLKIRVDGPFETTYGLAVANRRLASALADHTAHRVSIHCTEGPGDYLPRESDLEDKPLAARLWERSFGAVHPDVVIRNTYPPRFTRSSARIHLAYFFWEDSRLPPGWAEGFNSSFDGILAPTAYVRDVLRRSGVTIPIEVVPTVVEIKAGGAAPAGLPDGERKTTFLCVGSAFPRKGVDVLIRAFARAFRRGDDAALVIKSFPNVHNTVAAQLEALRREDPDAPEIVHVDRDISPQDLLDLYRGCDALVQPSRAEGFGLPVAEAMLLGIPVIAPSATGLADFCGPETAFVIPHRWEASQSHLATSGAEWAEPDEDALTDILKGFASGALREEARRRAANAWRLASERFSPRAVAREADAALERIERERRRPVSVGVASTWNSRCGIASYTKSLIDALPSAETRTSVFGNADFVPLAPDGPEVQRVWVQATGNYFHLVNEALERAIDTVHIQFHPALFTDYHELSRVIHGLCDRGVPVYVTVHLAVEEMFFYNRRMVLEDLAPAFARCEKVFVHGQRDAVRLAEIGLADNVHVMTHGGILFPQRSRAEIAAELGFGDRPVVATFGYAFAHKGILEAIEATARLRNRFPEILFLALAARREEAGSPEYLDLCRRRISELSLQESVLLLDDFLSEPEIGVLLSAADVVILPYGPTRESASGAVRYPLACGRATITTQEGIFDDVRDVAYQISGTDPETIAEAIEHVLSRDDVRRDLEERARRFALENSWPLVARRHLTSYRASLDAVEEGQRSGALRAS